MSSLNEENEGIWTPSREYIAGSNVAWLMYHAGVDSYDALHRWSVQNRESYWAAAIERLGIRFHKLYETIVDLSAGIESPRWLPGAEMNIVESCFSAPLDSPAIVYQKEGGSLGVLSAGELKLLSARVAAGLVHRGFKRGDALAILMPMTVECVAAYLGIIQAGCVAVGIADSFRPKEIATRLRLSNAVGIFTQDVFRRGGKSQPLYDGVIAAGAPPAIVFLEDNTTRLREGDCVWRDFLGDEKAAPIVVSDPSDPINILFSSGTTAEPKAIPWSQTTPIKCAADAHFHQNICPGDVLVWPTNTGWMMGPWLIFAGLMNRAAIGLYSGAPTGRPFGEFVQEARATMLGVVPSLVKGWRTSGCMEGLDWGATKLFSSTGECSSTDDMAWLMQRAGGRPIIEYCGGTEVGGGYITGTVARPCIAGTFNTPALGSDFVILDEEGCPAESGELFLMPPSMGLSTSLLNKDHHEVYFAGAPCGPQGEKLRRHGDQMMKLAGGYWRSQGRADDAMNLGGIKVSSAEIEHVVQTAAHVIEAAAIAVSTDGGQSKLVIYAVCSGSGSLSKEHLAAAMQSAIKRDLNPLFKIHDVVLIEALPRTASNKIMRRALRDQYVSAL